jgi:hypothetical protein
MPNEPGDAVEKGSNAPLPLPLLSVLLAALSSGAWVLDEDAAARTAHPLSTAAATTSPAWRLRVAGGLSGATPGPTTAE